MGRAVHPYIIPMSAVMKELNMNKAVTNLIHHTVLDPVAKGKVHIGMVQMAAGHIRVFSETLHQDLRKEILGPQWEETHLYPSKEDRTQGKAIIKILKFHFPCIIQEQKSFIVRDQRSNTSHALKSHVQRVNLTQELCNVQLLTTRSSWVVCTSGKHSLK